MSKYKGQFLSYQVPRWGYSSQLESTWTFGVCLDSSWTWLWVQQAQPNRCYPWERVSSFSSFQERITSKQESFNIQAF